MDNLCTDGQLEHIPWETRDWFVRRRDGKIVSIAASRQRAIENAAKNDGDVTELSRLPAGDTVTRSVRVQRLGCRLVEPSAA